MAVFGSVVNAITACLRHVVSGTTTLKIVFMVGHKVAVDLTRGGVKYGQGGNIRRSSPNPLLRKGF